MVSGVNTPPLRYFANSSAAHFCASGVLVVSMPAVSCCRENGRGRVGIGCVSAATSPGTSLAGNFRYSMGKTGLPVSRSKTKT